MFSDSCWIRWKFFEYHRCSFVSKTCSNSICSSRGKKVLSDKISEVVVFTCARRKRCVDWWQCRMGLRLWFLERRETVLSGIGCFCRTKKRFDLTSGRWRSASVITGSIDWSFRAFSSIRSSVLNNESSVSASDTFAALLSSWSSSSSNDELFRDIDGALWRAWSFTASTRSLLPVLINIQVNGSIQLRVRVGASWLFVRVRATEMSGCFLLGPTTFDSELFIRITDPIGSHFHCWVEPG